MVEVFCSTAHDFVENNNSLTSFHFIVPFIQERVHPFEHSLLRTAEDPHFLHESANHAARSSD